MVVRDNDTHRPGAPALPARDQRDIWLSLLEDLRDRMLELEQRSRWTIEWAILRWAGEHLSSTAIRIDGSEGLTGPAPARWRLCIHIDTESGAFALAILEGRTPLAATNVIASMLVSGDAEVVIASRGGGRRRWPSPDPDPSSTRWLRTGVDRLVDHALGRDTPPLDGVLPRPLALANALF